jgi:hypothetical protein
LRPIIVDRISSSHLFLLFLRFFYTHERIAMRDHLLALDRLLRGDTTRPDQLREGRLNIDLSSVVLMVVLLGAIYGLCMGSYSVFKEVPESLGDPYGRYKQLAASTIKVPALFFLTLIVTFPSLYVFNSLVGSRLSLRSVLSLLLASLGVNLAVLASLGPIVLFFSASTKSYAFIQILNVAAFTVAGVLGLTFLLQTLHRLTTSIADASIKLTPVDVATPGQGLAPDMPVGDRPLLEEPSALDMPSGETLAQHTRLVFGCWVVVFALVGAQMGWVLRPFIGSPELPFTLFRERSSNFFEAVLNAVVNLLGGGK